MTELKNRYDVVVIGAGSGGMTAAIGLARIGKSVLLVSETIGGDCTHAGCVPSKRLLHLARTVYSATSEMAKQQLRATVFSQVRETVAEVVQHDRELLQGDTLTFVQGTARFVDPHRIKITLNAGTGNSADHEVVFSRAVIATGSRPRIIPIDGVPEEMILTNETLFQLEQIPDHLVIIGGGPIGAEMATAFAQLGARVTMVIRSNLMPLEPERIRSEVRCSLESMGVTVHEGVESQTYDQKKHELILQRKQGSATNHVKKIDKILMAVGRVANTEGLGLGKAKIAYDSDGIRTSVSLQTNHHHISAIGDVIHEPNFTHLADNHARFVVEKTLMPWKRRSIGAVPAVTFSDPPVGHVGFIPSEKGYEEGWTFTKVFSIDFAQTDRARIEQEKSLVGVFAVNMLTGRLKGVSLVGSFAEHALPFFSLMIEKKVSLFSLGRFMTPYPTYLNGVQMLYREFLTTFLADLRMNLVRLLQQNLNRILAAVFWLVIALGLLAYLQSISFNMQQLVTDLVSVLSSPYGMALFFLVYTLRGMIAFPATALSVVSGVVYGFWGGTVLTILASNLSSAFAYKLGQTIFGKRQVSELEAESIVAQPGVGQRLGSGGIRSYIRGNTFEAVMVLRLAAAPYDLVSYIAGSLRVPFWQFLAGTALGALPGSVAVVSFGASLENVTEFDQFSIDPVYLGIGIVLLIVSITISQILRRRRNAVQ